MTDQELIQELHTFAGKPVDYAELVGSPVPSSYGISFVYEDPESYCMVEAAERIEEKIATIAALQFENAEFKKRIEAKEIIINLQDATVSLQSIDRDEAIHRMRAAEAALSRMEAERDAAAAFIQHIDREYGRYINDAGFGRWRGVQGVE